MVKNILKYGTEIWLIKEGEKRKGLAALMGFGGEQMQIQHKIHVNKINH